MSFAAITKVANIKTGDDKSKSVLLWLAFHLNDETGLCCPSISLLRKETEVGSDNTIRAALSRLREKGLVSWTREIEDGCVKRTLYTLNLDASKGEPASAIEPTSAIEVPQPLKGGTSTIEGGYFNGCAGVPHPLKENKEIEQGKEQGREQGSFSPAFACDAPADGVAHKTGVTPCAADWASLLSETAPADDVPPGLFDDLPPEPAPVAKPAAKKPKRSRAASDAWPVEGDGIDEETRSAYLAVRKAKRVGPFTAKAYEQIKAQGEKFGRSIAETIGVCIGRGWVYPYDSALQQSNSTNGKNNGIQDDRRGFVLTPQSEYDYEAGLRMFEERRAARRARDA